MKTASRRLAGLVRASDGKLLWSGTFLHTGVIPWLAENGADSNLKCNTPVHISRVSMGRHYSQLSATERNDLHSRILNGESLRSIARSFGRVASTLSREISRNSDE